MILDLLCLCNAQAASETDASEDFEALEELLR
jgi:hypothetical protein